MFIVINYPVHLMTSDPIPGSDHRSAYIAVIGRPNVGKSTLLNRVLKQKIAIVSPKPQTTRDQLLGIVTLPDAQLLFLDTPGLHKPLHKLGEHMVRVTEETIRDVDVVLWVVDAAVPPTDEDRLIADLLQSIHRKKPIASLVLGLNKIDENREMSEAQRSERKELYQELLAWRTQADPSFETISFSALRGTGIDELLALLCSIAPPGPRYYSEDEVTDLQTRFIAAELIREKALHLLGEEVPHSLAVEVDEFSERSSQMTYISAVLYVERESQKAIVLGKGGRTIKKIGQAARPEIEELVGTRVYLELWVKVWERWRKREDMLRRLGYAIGKES